MKLGFSTKICPQYTLEGINELVKKTGFKYIEFQVEREQKHGIDKLSRDITGNSSIINYLNKSQLKPWVLATSITLNEEAYNNYNEINARIKLWAKVAERLDIQYLRVFPSHNEINKTILIELLKKISSEINSYPVKVLIENHGGVPTAKELKSILDTVNNDNIKAIWDIAHSIVHEESVEKAYQILSPYIRHIHIKDFKKTGDNERINNPYDNWKKFVPFGTGDFPLNKIKKILEKNNYSGVISAEMEAAYAEPDKCLLDIKKYF